MDETIKTVTETFDLTPPFAVVVVLLRGSRVLLCQGKPKARTWCLPGGKVEPEDLTPEDAVLREFEEECGEREWSLALYEPFFMGSTHDGKPLWAYLGRISPKIPDSWDGPEGRCEFVELAAAPQLYRPDWLQTFCRVMLSLPVPPTDPDQVVQPGLYLYHLNHCAPCRAHLPCSCNVGAEAYRLAVLGH